MPGTMASPNRYLRFAAALLLLTQHPSLVSAQGLSRLANGFIVEYADVPESANMDNVVQNVFSQVQEATGGAVKVAHKLDLRSSLFNGASFTVLESDPSPEQSAQNLDTAMRRRAEGETVDDVLESTLMQMPAIAAVYPNRVHYLQAAVDIPQQVYSEEEIEDYQSGFLKRRKENNDRLYSAKMSEALGSGYLRTRQETENGTSNAIIYPAEGTPLVNPHMLTGVDKLHTEGVTGRGIRIAIIDSGIDPSHPILGGGYGPGFKVEGGYDFVGDQPNNDVDPPAPDDSPITTCANHGTATSSIAAGLPFKFGFVGVAPNATIMHYKVFPCSGSVTTDVGVNASLAAYESGVDVINASIGGQGGWGSDLWSIIARRIMDMGTVYMIAAGNDGNRGTFIANSLNSGAGVPSIGSVDNAYTTTLLANGSYTIDGGEPVAIRYAPGFPANWTFGVSETAPLELFIPPSVNGCIPYPANATYSNNSVVLLPRAVPGSAACDQAAQAKAAGIRKMLTYNWIDGIPTRPLPLATTEGYPFDWLDATANIDNAVGVELARLVSGGAKVQLDLPWRPSDDTRVPRVQENYLTAGFMSNYSTWGPTYEAKIGTTFSAPGGNYLAAGGTIYGGYVVASGTSFSSPYAAGVAALLKQVHPNITAVEIINRLATTAKPIKMQTNLRVTQDYLAPTFQQGGGLVDAYAAVHTTTTFNASDLAFNDTSFIQPQSFEIYNQGNETVTYELSHTPGPTIYTFTPGNTTVTPFSNDTAFASNTLADVSATLEFSTGTSMSMTAGGSQVITVTATPPAGLDNSRLPLYSGFVSIKASNGFNFSIPYGGIASPLRDVPVLDTRPGQERTYLIANITADETEEFVRPGLDGNNVTSAFVIPQVVGNISTSTALWNVTLPGFSVSTLFGSRRAEVSLLQDTVSLGSVLTVGGELPIQDSTFVRDSPATQLFYGKLADGTFVEAGGPYRFRVRLLRVTGDVANAEDWDEVVTEPFELSYA